MLGGVVGEDAQHRLPLPPHPAPHVHRQHHRHLLHLWVSQSPILTQTKIRIFLYERRSEYIHSKFLIQTNILINVRIKNILD